MCHVLLTSMGDPPFPKQKWRSGLGDENRRKLREGLGGEEGGKTVARM